VSVDQISRSFELILTAGIRGALDHIARPVTVSTTVHDRLSAPLARFVASHIDGPMTLGVPRGVGVNPLAALGLPADLTDISLSSPPPWAAPRGGGPTSHGPGTRALPRPGSPGVAAAPALAGDADPSSVPPSGTVPPSSGEGSPLATTRPFVSNEFWEGLAAPGLPEWTDGDWCRVDEPVVRCGGRVWLYVAPVDQWIDISVKGPAHEIDARPLMACVGDRWSLGRRASISDAAGADDVPDTPIGTSWRDSIPADPDDDDPPVAGHAWAGAGAVLGGATFAAVCLGAALVILLVHAVAWALGAPL